MSYSSTAYAGHNMSKALEQSRQHNAQINQDVTNSYKDYLSDAHTRKTEQEVVVNTHTSTVDSLLAQLKDCTSILDEVLLVMMLGSINTADSAKRISDSLLTVNKSSQQLKKIIDAIDALNTYIKEHSDPNDPNKIDLPLTAEKLQEIANDPKMGKFKAALMDTELGSYVDGGDIIASLQKMTGVAIEDIQNITQSAAPTVGGGTDSNGVVHVGDLNTILTATNSSDIQAATLDYYKQGGDAADAATNVSATKSAALQGQSNNYQMQLGLAVSFLQTIHDLNSRITSSIT